MPIPNAIKAQVEIRVPTFRRPDLLIRALRSLQTQTRPHWRAIVIDDSTGQEGAMVVAQLADARIVYQPNARNLGRTANLNFCFRPEPFLTGSTHACVLEDDNWYDPEWLASNLQAMHSNQALVLARNYRLYDVPLDGTILPNADPVMASLYGNTPRWVSLQDRARECFFNYGMGNLGYLWRLNTGLDLSMRHEHFHVHVAETGRCVSFTEPCWFEPTPLASFSRFLDKRQTPSGEAPGTRRRRRMAKVSEIEFTRRIWKLWEEACERRISEIVETASVRNKEGQDALLKLAEAGCLAAFRHLHFGRQRVAVLKSWVVDLLYRRVWHQETSLSTFVNL